MFFEIKTIVFKIKILPCLLLCCSVGTFKNGVQAETANLSTDAVKLYTQDLFVCLFVGFFFVFFL